MRQCTVSLFTWTCEANANRLENKPTIKAQFPRTAFGTKFPLADDAGVDIYGFMRIVDRLTINGEKDASYRLRVNGDKILNGLARIISTLLLDSVAATLYLRTAADNSVLGLTAQQLRDELSVYTQAHVDSLLAGKANAGHIHGFSLYTETAGDPPHEHLVQGTTGIDQ